MAGEEKLPTISEAISNWLGLQLTGLPQTLKNTDKAIGKLILAAAENLEARMRNNTGKVKAQGKIDVEGMYRTQEEERKLENRAATMKAALEEMEGNSNAQQTDAKSEIEDDWLNLSPVFLRTRVARSCSSSLEEFLLGKSASLDRFLCGQFS
jgi:hypothetical protein